MRGKIGSSSGFMGWETILIFNREFKFISLKKIIFIFQGSVG